MSLEYFGIKFRVGVLFIIVLNLMELKANTNGKNTAKVKITSHYCVTKKKNVNFVRKSNHLKMFQKVYT